MALMVGRFVGAVAIGVAALIACVEACSSGSSSGASGDAGAGDGSSGDDGGDGGDAAKLPASGCKLAAVEGVDSVSPTFAFYDPPTSQPAATTGGNPSGKYKVIAAKFYLPTNTKSVAHPDASGGTVTAWSVFDGTSYRFFLHAAATIDTSIGPQPQNNDVASQGTFTVNGSSLIFDYACETAPPDPLPEITFTDDGSGKSTIVIKSPTAFGDGYLELQGQRL